MTKQIKLKDDTYNKLKIVIGDSYNDKVISLLEVYLKSTNGKPTVNPKLTSQPTVNQDILKDIQQKVNNLHSIFVPPQKETGGTPPTPQP